MYRTKYSTKWDEAFEQQVERIRPYMSVYEPKTISGEAYEIPRLGGTEAHEFSGRSHKMTADELDTGKTTMRPRQFYNYIEISANDQLFMGDLDYGFSQIQERQKRAAARFIDMVALGVVKDETAGFRLKSDADEGYLGGILGVRYSGNGGLTQSALDLSIDGFKNRHGNLVPVDYRTSGTGVSANYAGTVLDRLAYAKQRMEELDVFDGAKPGDICVAISPAVRRMLRSLELKLNRDYGFEQLGAEGSAVFVKDLNMTFLVTNMLPKMDTVKSDGSTEVPDARMCCMWLKSRVAFASWRNTEWTMKDVNDDAVIDHGLRVRGAVGATRLDEESVFVLPIVESM